VSDTAAAPKLTEAFAEVGELRIFYAAAGAGEPVICLHGTGPGASGLANFAANVGALAGRFRVIVPDLPRFGRSSKVAPTGPRLDYLSGVIRGLMDALGLGRAHFVGNSMGGQAALKLAIDTPDRAGRLALVAPAPLSHSVLSPMPAEAVRLIAGYYQGAGPSREKMRQLLTALVYDPAAITEDLLEQRYQASVEEETVAVNRAPHWAVQSLDRELEQVAAPTLLIWGIDDRASPFDQALTMLRRLPDARLHVFARCGHSVQLEYPEEFNQLVLGFLSGGG
jgi:4,5:9,10-diseco-3-hydroxy-5,9,17-trioxoandrosta-1(10),2-diene-4-oate hydrolase